RTTRWTLWWDGDLLRELYERATISKWDWETGHSKPLQKLGARRANWPNLAGDFLGDWREEVLIAAPDGKSLRLYTTTAPTHHRLYTLMHDPQYRLSIASQNVAYNKPPNAGFFIGHDMAAPPKPDIQLIGN